MSSTDSRPPAGADQPREELPQGSEAPPPGVRTMAIVRWVLIGLMAVAAVAAWVHFARTGSEITDRSEAKYVCPMHPSVLSERPGSCPICGMDLVPIASLGQAAKGPSGPQGHDHAGAQGAAGKYWCPMHPEVSSDDPNAICEKCGGMKLIPRAQVPGLTPIDVSADRLQLIGVRTAPALMEKLSPSLRTVGMVAPDEAAVAVVTSRITGWIEKLLVTQSGDRVKKGQPLARIYSPDIQAPQINYLNALRWTRDKAGPASAAATPAIETDARQRLLLLGFSPADVAEIEEKRTTIEFIMVRAPIDGYVGRREVQVGSYVSPGQELFEIADIAHVWVLADVYETDIGRVRAGQKATITLQALPGEVFTGKVAYLYPAVNPQSRTLQARIVASNSHGRLRPGMYADVVIDLGTSEGITIPADALVDTGEAQYVFVALPGGRFEPRPVSVGARNAERVQILRGVHPGENVVTTANFLIDSESRLRAAIQGFGGK